MLTRLKQQPLGTLLIVSFLLLAQLCTAQTKVVKGYIKDALSDERIPFASIQFIKSSGGKLSDSAGNFIFRFSDWPGDTLLVSYVGYKDYKVFIGGDFLKRAVGNEIEIVIGLDRGKLTSEAIVRKKIDRGLLMWKRIVKRKKFNDRYRFDNFAYELYNKLELDLNRINKDKMKQMGLLKPFGFILDNVDSTEAAPFLPVFLTETISDYFYQKSPYRTKEIIKGSKTQGVNNESASKLLGGTDQNVNVYANFIPVFDKQFVSPLSDNGDAYYNYKVLDSQFVNNRRLIHMTFQPKRKGENTFEGDCWVHDTTWAVQKMNLFLSKEANINFVEKLSMIQEYRLIDDSTWFLTKDKFVVDIAPIGKTRFGVIGRKTTTYKDVVVNQSFIADSVKQNKVLNEIIITNGASELADEFWKNQRHEDLNKNEKAVYLMIDTLQKMPLFKKYTRMINFIGTGYLPVGNYEIGPWQNWIFSNVVEGLRLRWDLGTNRHFNKNLILHGYLAYGFKDQKFKYQVDGMYLFNKNPRSYIFAKYSKDMDYGQHYMDEVSQDNIFALAIRKKNVPIKFLFTEEATVSLFKEWTPGLSVKLTGTQFKYNPLMNLPPKDIYTASNTLNTFETTLRLRFAYNEKFLENTFYRYSLGSEFPIAELRITKGTKGIFKSNYNYYKLFANVSDYLKIAPYGSLYYNVFAGKTTGTLPFMMLDVAPGNEIYYYNKYAYNLMNRWEYLHDRYAGFNLEHNIGNGLFRFIPLTRKLKFRQFWTLKGLWGSLSESNKQFNTSPDYKFQSLDGKTYMEVGTGVDNIFKVFRMDFIWRLAPRPLPAERNKRFGAFFSFRLAF
ncbi:MAG: carboxypeptidase-like regulatory domain-containing protein [Sphingobacteriales bacterium]|jgi:hypothetical protein|nr:MAG: carboxypeptidase-like regulatory domain-containing protein [Sphingobacteriales bacterium]